MWMDVSIGVYLYPLIVESVLVVFFLYVLATRGTQKGRNLLLISLIGILLLMIGTFLEVLRINAMPLGPPPETWEEGYYDTLFMRSMTLMKAQIDGIILFSLFISFMCMKYRESLIEEKVKMKGASIE